MNKSTCGIGFLGIGKYSRINNLKAYTLWSHVFQRCYNNNYLEKFPSYKGCSVHPDWHNFQVFAGWFEQNYDKKKMQGWHFDKDILFKGNKIYSPETCCFVPPEINTLFTKSNKNRGIYPIGVSIHNKRFKSYTLKEGKQIHLGTFDTPEEAFEAYKVAKEIKIKELAKFWKSSIEYKVYKALINYKVEITD